MAGDIGEGFLRHPVEDGAQGIGNLLYPGGGLEADAHSRFLHKYLHGTLQGRDQPEVVQHGGPQLPRKLVHAAHGLFHHLPGALDLLLKFMIMTGPGAGEGGDVDIDADEGLGDDVMQFPADALPLFFLSVQNLVGHAAESDLLLLGLLQKPPLFLLTDLQTIFDGLPP